MVNSKFQPLLRFLKLPLLPFDVNTIDKQTKVAFYKDYFPLKSRRKPYFRMIQLCQTKLTNKSVAFFLIVKNLKCISLLLISTTHVKVNYCFQVCLKQNLLFVTRSLSKLTLQMLRIWFDQSVRMQQNGAVCVPIIVFGGGVERCYSSLFLFRIYKPQ